MGTWCILGIRTPRMQGGGPPHAVGLLMAAPGWPETGLAQLELIFWHDGAQVPYNPGDEVFPEAPGASARWQDWIGALPRRRFSRKSRSLTVALRGDPTLDAIAELTWSELTSDPLRRAARMVAQGLESLAAGLSPRDGVDLSDLITRAWALCDRTWPDDAELQSELAAAYALDRARIEAMDPWAKVDLRGAAKGAGAILDDPVDWSEGDDFSPHGNDIGADILADWARVKRLMPEALWRRFEVLDGLDRVQAALGLAFAQVKKTGTCPPDLAAEVLDILAQDLGAAEERIGEAHLEAFRSRMARYQVILAGLAG